MSLIKIINSEHSAEFGQLITEIKANVLSYLEARQKELRRKFKMDDLEYRIDKIKTDALRNRLSQ